jgi:hypothetical protein
MGLKCCGLCSVSYTGLCLIFQDDICLILLNIAVELNRLMVSKSSRSLQSDIQGVTGGTDQTSGGVPYVKLYRKTPKHLYPKLNGLGDNGQ